MLKILNPNQQINTKNTTKSKLFRKLFMKPTVHVKKPHQADPNQNTTIWVDS